MWVYFWVNIPAWIYYNSELWLISISGDWNSWTTISDKNLWATNVWNSSDNISSLNCGWYYQRWNNYMFPFEWGVTTSQYTVNASSYWPWNYYSSSTFITTAPRDDSPYNYDLWWWITWTNSAMQWPCASWYHVPTQSEWLAIFMSWKTIWAWTDTASWRTNFSNYLKIPPAWCRNGSSWTVTWQWSEFRLWSSVRWNMYGSLQIEWNWSYFRITSLQSIYWLSIRPFANEAVVPNSEWEVIYQQS